MPPLASKPPWPVIPARSPVPEPSMMRQRASEPVPLWTPTASITNGAAAAVQRAVDPLQADEPGGLVGQVAHQPLDGAVALEVAGEPLRPAGVGQARLAGDFVVGVLVIGLDLERPGRGQGFHRCRHGSNLLLRCGSPQREATGALRRLSHDDARASRRFATARRGSVATSSSRVRSADRSVQRDWPGRLEVVDRTDESIDRARVRVRRCPPGSSGGWGRRPRAGSPRAVPGRSVRSCTSGSSSSSSAIGSDRCRSTSDEETEPEGASGHRAESLDARRRYLISRSARSVDYQRGLLRRSEDDLDWADSGHAAPVDLRGEPVGRDRPDARAGIGPLRRAAGRP